MTDRFSDEFFLPWTSLRDDGKQVPYQVVFTDDALSIRERIQELETKVELLQELAIVVIKAWNSRDGSAFTQSLKELRRALPREI